MSSGSVLVVRAGSRLILRCHESTIDASAADALVRVLREASESEGTGVIVLRIPREFAGMTTGAPELTALLAALCACRKPVVASIEHDVCAEALPMVALCDVAVMMEYAQLQGGRVATDTSVDAAVLQRLSLAMGHPKAFELVTLPRVWSAHECLRLGLISRLAPDREACGAMALELAERVSFVTRVEAWRIERNYLGRTYVAGEANPLLRTH